MPILGLLFGYSEKYRRSVAVFLFDVDICWENMSARDNEMRGSRDALSPCCRLKKMDLSELLLTVTGEQYAPLVLLDGLIAYIAPNLPTIHANSFADDYL
jgi:hypothetical protein